MSGSENTRKFNRDLWMTPGGSVTALQSEVIRDLDILAERVAALEARQPDGANEAMADPGALDIPPASPAAPLNDETLGIPYLLDPWLPPSHAREAAKVILSHLRRLGRLK